MESYFEHNSERLYFRKLNNFDIPAWEEFFVNNNRLHFLGFEPSKTNDVYAKEWIERQQDRYEKEGLGMLAVRLKSTDELIGLCGIILREIESKIIYEIGYSFIQKFWGKGYATEAAKHFKKIGVELGISERFVSLIHPDNIDSMKVAERNGMQVVGNSVFMEMPVVIYGDEGSFYL